MARDRRKSLWEQLDVGLSYKNCLAGASPERMQRCDGAGSAILRARVGKFCRRHNGCRTSQLPGRYRCATKLTSRPRDGGN